MEEEMITHCNIMPVDLAIKRELEYRKKMELLNNRHQNDFKPLVLAQGTISESQTMVDQKRKLQPYNAHRSQTLLSSAKFLCVACRMAFATVYHLKTHGETFAHKTKLLQTRTSGENISNPFFCELCDISCSSGTVMEFHVAGLKHICLQRFEDAKRAKYLGSFASN